jgi:hypothetical protein
MLYSTRMLRVRYRRDVLRMCRSGRCVRAASTLSICPVRTLPLLPMRQTPYLSLSVVKCQGTTPASGNASCLGAVHVPRARLPEACPVRPHLVLVRPLVQAVLHHLVQVHPCPLAVAGSSDRKALRPLPQYRTLGSQRLPPRTRPVIPTTSSRLTSCTQKPSFHRL